MSYIPEVKDSEITDESHVDFLRGYNAALEELETAKLNLEAMAKVGDLSEDSHIGILEKIIEEISENAINECILRLQLTLKEIRCAMADEEFINKGNIDY